MALGDAYCTTGEAKDHLGIGDALDDTYLDRVTKAVTRSFIRFCGRDFNDAGSASARVFHPCDSTRVDVHEFHTTTGLVVKTDPGDDGTYDQTISSSDYTLYPLDGIVDGQTGFPYRTIRLKRGAVFPVSTVGPSVQVTARWGWSAVPDDVKQAALIQTAHVFSRKFSHNGLIGQGEFVFRVSRAALDPDAADLLAPYRPTGFIA